MSTDFERGACRIVEISKVNDDDAAEAPGSQNLWQELLARTMSANTYTAFLVHMPDRSTYRAPHFPGALETAEARGARIIEEIQVRRIQDTGYAFRENAASDWIDWPVFETEESQQ